MRASKMDRFRKAPNLLEASAVLGTLAALCLAACGGESAPASQTDSQETQQVSACDFLTPAEILEVTGVDPGEPVSRELGSGFLECRWIVAGGSDQLTYVAYRPTGAPLTYEAWVDEYKTSLGEDFDPSMLEDYELVSVTDDQFTLYSDAGSLGGLFQTYTGGRALIVGTMAIDGKSNRTVAMSLAAKATDRLP